MKKRNLQLLVLSLFLVLAQNSLAVKLEQGTGNEAASEESVAIGLSYTDTNGVEHKNIAGNPTKANEKYYATAIGIANTANEKWSSAFGYGNTASGLKASAFGYNNKASARENSAFGYNNTASKDGASAFGYNNKASARKSSAFGYENTVSGTDSSAFGYRNTASSDRASAFGYRNTASARESLAFGYQNIASAMKSSAFGYNNTASELFSSAFGYNNIASKISSSAFGYENTASGEKASAFGYNNTASGERASTFGNANTVGKLKDDGSGKKVPDENYGKNSLIFGTKYQVTGNSSGAFGIGKANWNGTTKQYDYDYVNEGNNSYMIGNLNKIASGSDDNFILGNNVEIGAGITKSVVLGDGSTSGGSNTVSVGSASLQRKIVNVGDGTISATSTDAVTGKQLYSGDGIDTATWKARLGVNSGGVDLTPYTKKDASNLTASDINDWQRKLDVTKKDDYKDANDINVAAWKTKLGVGSGRGTPIDVYTKTESDNKFVDKISYNTDKTNFATKTDLGAYTKKDASNLTASDINKWKAKLGVSAGGGSGIANSATGNGSTGLGIDNTVTGNYSTAVGYKNKVSGNHSGAFGDPNIITGNGSYAIGNDNTINGNNNFVLGNNVNIGAGIQNSVALGNNSTVSSSNEVSVGSKGKERKITNVADGEVSATSTDAVTGKQLYKAMQNSGALGIENLRNEVYEKIDDVKSEVRGIGSLSAALAGLHPMQYDPKAPAQVMAALGHYKNRQAVAVGASYHFNDRFMMSTGIALSGERKTKTMANIGFTLKLGKGSGVTYNETPQYVVQNEVKRLTVENNKQAKENQELKAEVNSLITKTREQDEKIKNLEEKLNMLLKNK